MQEKRSMNSQKKRKERKEGWGLSIDLRVGFWRKVKVDLSVFRWVVLGVVGG